MLPVMECGGPVPAVPTVQIPAPTGTCSQAMSQPCPRSAPPWTALPGDARGIA
jgi:hypothetical protein